MSSTVPPAKRDLAALAAALCGAHLGERGHGLLDIGAEGVERGDNGERVLRNVRPRCAEAVGDAPPANAHGDVRPLGIERPHFRADVGVFMAAERDDARAVLLGAAAQAARNAHCRD